MLARLHRAGELTPIWIPDAAHEAMRDLVRARATAVRALSKARQHLQGFLLRHDRICHGARAWTLAYRRWLTTVRFDHPAQQIVLQDYIHTVEDAECRRDRLTRQIEELMPTWSMALVAAALQAMRGVALVVAVTVVAEVGDFRRFTNARQLMAYLGLVPSEAGKSWVYFRSQSSTCDERHRYVTNKTGIQNYYIKYEVPHDRNSESGRRISQTGCGLPRAIGTSSQQFAHAKLAPNCASMGRLGRSCG